MSKVNPLKKSSDLMETERLAGDSGLRAAKQDNISLLRRAVLANLLWENVAYMDGESVSKEIERLVPLCKSLDLCDLVIEAKEKQKLRHIPLFLMVQMLKYENHKKFVKSLLPTVITRPDMITDFVAIYAKCNDNKVKPLPNVVKKGLSECFNKFSEYQFAKYDRSSAITLRDVMFLVHPKPTQGKEDLFKKIASRTLDTPDTWEVALSTGKDKKQTWERLINENKLGGLAMLRNVRNMKEANVDKKIIVKGLETIKSQMLLPLNFFSSAKINPEFSREIEDVMIESYKNLPKLPGRTLFIVDVSGSMGMANSSDSSYSRLDHANIMAILAANQCEDYELVCTAGNDGAYKGSHLHIKYPTKGFDLAKEIVKTRNVIGQGGIFTRQCLEWCKLNVPGDFERIIVFSDSQDCDRYDRIPNPYGKYNYICDVSSHTKGINFKGKWSAEISGFSEHFITFIAGFEGIENKFESEDLN